MNEAIANSQWADEMSMNMERGTAWLETGVGASHCPWLEKPWQVDRWTRALRRGGARG